MATDTSALPTPRLYAGGAADVDLSCRDCLHRRYADLPALVAAGQGDVPLIELRWRCSACGSGRVDWVEVQGAGWYLRAQGDWVLFDGFAPQPVESVAWKPVPPF